MPDDYPHCVHCARRIEYDRYKFIWVHAHNGFTLCEPFKEGKTLKATPPALADPPEVKSRTSGTKPVHFGEPEYRPACGLPVASTKISTMDTTAVTCMLCQGTLKYKKAVQKMTTPTDPVTHYVAGANSSAACGKGLNTAPVGTRWTNDTGRVNCPSCKASAMFLEAVKSRTSVTNRRTSTDQAQQALMDIYPERCLAIYRDRDTGDKNYCGLDLFHDGNCGPVKSAEEVASAWFRPGDTAPQSEWSKLVGPRSTGVYCVHCQQYHAPRQHVVSFDYPPIPYARQAFETRAADLRTEMEQYISGRSNRDELDVAMIRIDQEYLNAMADLHRQGLI